MYQKLVPKNKTLPLNPQYWSIFDYLETFQVYVNPINLDVKYLMYQIPLNAQEVVVYQQSQIDLNIK